MRKIIGKIVFFAALAAVLAFPAWAADDIPPAFRSTGYPIPRFVSLNKNEAFVRAGPAQHYPVKWTYKRAGLPLEIILEFENWRKVRDIDGQEGWVFYSLLSGNRTGIITGTDMVQVLKKPKHDSIAVANLQQGVIMGLEACEPAWCQVTLKTQKNEIKGWVSRKFIWGIYEGENFD